MRSIADFCGISSQIGPFIKPIRNKVQELIVTGSVLPLGEDAFEDNQRSIQHVLPRIEMR